MLTDLSRIMHPIRKSNPFQNQYSPSHLTLFYHNELIRTESVRGVTFLWNDKQIDIVNEPSQPLAVIEATSNVRPVKTSTAETFAADMDIDIQSQFILRWSSKRITICKGWDADGHYRFW